MTGTTSDWALPFVCGYGILAAGALWRRICALWTERRMMDGYGDVAEDATTERRDEEI